MSEVETLSNPSAPVTTRAEVPSGLRPPPRRHPSICSGSNGQSGLDRGPHTPRSQTRSRSRTFASPPAVGNPPSSHPIQPSPQPTPDTCKADAEEHYSAKKTTQDSCHADGPAHIQVGHHDKDPEEERILRMHATASGGQEDSRGAAPSILGPSILIASRLGAYTLASWGLLAADVSANNVQDGAAEPPFHRFCDALKILLRYHILLAERLAVETPSPEALQQVLLYVLLWQFIKHSSVMLLVELALERCPDGTLERPTPVLRRMRRRRMPTAAALASLPTPWPARSAHRNFLEEVGVPLMLKVLNEAQGTITGAVDVPGQAKTKGGAIDMATVLRTALHASQVASPSCSSTTVDALLRDSSGLHRAASFLQEHHQFVTPIVSGVDYTADQLEAAYATIAHCSVLLQPTDSSTGSSSGRLQFVENAAVARAASVLAKFNAQADSSQRAAKETILDARITAARMASWNADVAACSVRAAVAKDLKSMLHQWAGQLDAAIGGDSLPEDAWLAASDAATAAFDIVPGSPASLRFRVPSAGFMLVWITSPGSPSHELRQEKAPTTALSAPDVRATAANVPEGFAAGGRGGGCGGMLAGASGDASRSADSIAQLVRLGGPAGGVGSPIGNPVSGAAPTWGGALKRPRPRMSA